MVSARLVPVSQTLDTIGAGEVVGRVISVCTYLVVTLKSPQYPTMNSVHILVIGSGPNVFRDQLEALVKDPSKDLFSLNDPPQSVVKRMDDWAKEICKMLN